MLHTESVAFFEYCMSSETSGATLSKTSLIMEFVIDWPSFEEPMSGRT